MLESFTLLTALLAGLAANLHCIGMCGGISSALSLSVGECLPGKRAWFIVLFSTGRLASYSMLGFLAASIGLMMSSYIDTTLWSWVFRFGTAIILALIGAYLAFANRWLENIAVVGAGFWPGVKKMLASCFPVDRNSKALFAGLAWGLLPCAMVYALLSSAWLSSNPVHGTLMMLAFGLGTLPSMLLSGLMAIRLKKLLAPGSGVQRISGLLLILFAIWTASGPWLVQWLDLPPQLAGCK